MVAKYQKSKQSERPGVVVVFNDPESARENKTLIKSVGAKISRATHANKHTLCTSSNVTLQLKFLYF